MSLHLLSSLGASKEIVDDYEEIVLRLQHDDILRVVIAVGEILLVGIIDIAGRRDGRPFRLRPVRPWRDYPLCNLMKISIFVLDKSEAYEESIDTCRRSVRPLPGGGICTGTPERRRKRFRREAHLPALLRKVVPAVIQRGLQLHGVLPLPQ